MISFEKKGYNFKQIRPVGSLKNALFSASHSTSKNQNALNARFDFGLVSQFRVGLVEAHPIRALLGYKDLLELFSNYVKRHPELDVCTMLRSGVMDQDYEAEVHFHQQYLGIRANLIPNSEDGWSSYVATEESDVVVSSSSALGFESLGRGCKTLICARPVLRDVESHAFHADWILPVLLVMDPFSITAYH